MADKYVVRRHNRRLRIWFGPYPLVEDPSGQAASVKLRLSLIRSSRQDAVSFLPFADPPTRPYAVSFLPQRQSRCFLSELIWDHSLMSSTLIVMISSVSNRSGSVPRL